MSAFLGPIHYWLFNKIQFQNDIINTIIKQYDQLHLKELLKKYGELEQGSLENIIDETNIHGWLQERISLVEYRFADCVTAIINNDPNAFENMKKIIFEFGKNKAVKGDNAKDLFVHLNDLLLDGMPCDRVNEIISENNDEIIWIHNHFIHKRYWEEIEGDITNYYSLREFLINGMLEESFFEYKKLKDNMYAIRRDSLE